GSGYYPYSYGIGYDAPYTSGVAYDPGTPLVQASDASTANTSIPTDPANGTGGNAAGSVAHITVRLPENADLWLHGTKVTATGPVRVFNTPPLAPGSKYTYAVRARWLDNDTTMDQKQTIVFTPGENVEVSFPTTPGTGDKAKDTITP